LYTYNFYFRYADSYNILEEENKSLRCEIKDLKANLKINKEIIEGFFGSSSKKDQYAMYVSKLKEENGKLTKQIEKISEEREELRSKVVYTLL
jgi:predicted RNase H-like nuclease (RuvC/YqgF family)